ncbi:MAG TPA: PGPGW domain-containing protein [Phycisphaerae bacterium]|nr:PGPGW domain-containing protein [Phycisphaerae bacterium]
MLLKNARRVIIAVIGGTVLLFSLVGYVMPIIPGIPLTFLGLAILATEFVWAKRLLRKAKVQASALMDNFRSKPAADEDPTNGPK